MTAKQSYRYALLGHTDSELAVLKQVAVSRFVMELQSRAFLDALGVSKSSAGKIIARLVDMGVVEHELEKGYRISDPILGHYLSGH